MPIIWRYLFSNFIFIFILSSTSFIALLLVSRFKEIAKFITFSSGPEQVIIFILYQIPLILPLIIPLCCLLAGYLLAQNLSRESIITTLRASAISLKSLLIPILFISTFLGLANFTITGNLSSKCKRLTRQMIHTESSTNPLSLLQKMTLGKMRRHFIQITPSKNPDAKNALLILKNENLNRTTLISMKNLKTTQGIVEGENFNSISYIPEKTNLFDSLILESQKSIEIDAQDFLKKIEMKSPKLGNDSLEISILRLKSKEKTKKASKALSEIFGRVSLSFATISLAALGFVFGLKNARIGSRKTLAYIMLNTSIFITCYLIGKGLKNPFYGAFVVFLPHLYLALTIAKQIQNIDKGKV